MKQCLVTVTRPTESQILSLSHLEVTYYLYTVISDICNVYVEFPIKQRETTIRRKYSLDCDFNIKSVPLYNRNEIISFLKKGNNFSEFGEQYTPAYRVKEIEESTSGTHYCTRCRNHRMEAEFEQMKNGKIKKTCKRCL